MLVDDNLLSFGTLLKAFRKRSQFSQEQLAEAVGTHRNTIARWEQGDFLPKNRAMVLELAKHMHLTDQETCHLLEASLTALTPYWQVPLPRNSFFTGREKVLKTMHEQLGIDQTVARAQSSALHGLGGFGKTQVALEYAYRYALEYSAVFWIGAESEENIISSFLSIAETLQLPEQDDKDQLRVVAAVQHWLTTHNQWLLIYDNVEDLELLDRFLPSSRSGAILMTTRCQALGTYARGVDLLPIEHEEGILFLLHRAKILAPETTREHLQQFAERFPAQYAAASELVTVLGGLLLALDQAGAYLEETHCGLPAYLDLFKTRRIALLQQRGHGSRDHPASVSTTFTLTITATIEQHPEVLDFLHACALLQPDVIPEELFCQGGKYLGPPLEAVCCDPLEWNRMVSVACRYSLLSRQLEKHTLSMHRLVQTVLLDTMTDVEREHKSRQVFAVLNAMFPEASQRVWECCERLLPHVLTCANAIPDYAGDLQVVEVLRKAADYLRTRVQYRQAEVLYQRALSIGEQVLGPEHPLIALPLNNMASLYFDEGKYELAVPLYQRALHIWEQALGPEHPEVTHALGGLADLYFAQEKYELAEALHQRALHIREQAWGPEHCLVIFPLNNLADVYTKQGKSKQAELSYQRAVRVGEQAWGCEHPYIAVPLNGLANLYCTQGRYMLAELLFQRALSIRERHLGQHHPDTAQTLHDLAIFRQKQGNLSEAISLASRAQNIRSQALGNTHIKTVATQTLSAQLLLEQTLEQEESVSRSHAEGSSNLCGNKHQTKQASRPLYKGYDLSSTDDDSLQGFLDTCCEFHPRAWSSFADLWQAYECWTKEHQERFPLSRKEFIAQLKAHSCHADRTKVARIWRGIALVKRNHNGSEF